MSATIERIVIFFNNSDIFVVVDYKHEFLEFLEWYNRDDIAILWISETIGFIV